jgi:hypothetical protein
MHSGLQVRRAENADKTGAIRRIPVRGRLRPRAGSPAHIHRFNERTPQSSDLLSASYLALLSMPELRELSLCYRLQ